jgi:predicted nuclease with TOPRIM domain
VDDCAADPRNLPYGAANELLDRLHERERDLAAANARISELEREKQMLGDAHDMWKGQCAEANAWIAGLEQQAAYAGQGWAMWETANARADAAERDSMDARIVSLALENERDQLVARVTELESALASTWPGR